MKPGYSTRLGAAIRQAGMDLIKQPNYRKLLLILSDGEPSDIDVEDQDYLLEDAKYAVRRLAYNGVDVLTIMQTKKGMKQHVYDKVRGLNKKESEK